jgi:hypothetical protein
VRGGECATKEVPAAIEDEDDDEYEDDEAAPFSICYLLFAIRAAL